MKVVAIIQARMGSTRLAGKVMMKLQNKTVLEHVIIRVRQSKLVNQIVIATTNNIEDNQIVDQAKQMSVDYFRGSEEDVLSRYYYAAKKNNADIVVRITSDCPIIDPRIIDEMLEKFIGIYKKEGIDYMSNTLQQSFPRGLDVEIFTFNTLVRAYNEGKQKYEREHVTPYIYMNLDKFKVANFTNKVDHSNYRWTLDTKEDFELINIIYQKLYYNNIFLYQDVIELFNKNPYLFEINKDVQQKKI